LLDRKTDTLRLCAPASSEPRVSFDCP
jgi:hypothetical protein